MTVPDKNPAGEASAQETGFANELMKATADDDYQAFIADGDKDFKSLPRDEFKAVGNQVSSKLKGGYHVVFLAAFHLKRLPDHVTLWKVSYDNGGDDDLLHLMVNNGKITGATLTSPLNV